MHKDILGNVINDGDSIVYPDHNRMKVGSVKKSTPKMVMVQAVGRTYTDRKYPHEVLVVDDPKISMYILKNSK
jgi:hypothetical protein